MINTLYDKMGIAKKSNKTSKIIYIYIKLKSPFLSKNAQSLFFNVHTYTQEQNIFTSDIT